MSAILPIAANTIANGFARAERGAEKLAAGVAGDGADAAEGVADLIVGKAQVQAGTALVRLADEMQRALIEIGAD